MFWREGVSSYKLRAMEKTNFCILLFFVFLTSMCNSNDYTYDSNEYDEYTVTNVHVSTKLTVGTSEYSFKSVDEGR